MYFIYVKYCFMFKKIIIFVKNIFIMGRSNEKIHVQINSLEALERLIGNDSNFEFDIRQNIVQKFAEKHLKSVANSAVLKEIEENIKNYVYDNTSYKNKLSNSFKDKIKNVVESEYTDILTKAFFELRRKHTEDLNRKIKTFEERFSDEMIKHFEEKHIQKIIDARVDAKIKRMLKMIYEDENGTTKVSSISDI